MSTRGTADHILDAYIEGSDVGSMVVRAYLMHLLGELWDKKEAFNSKRPFGNSDWEHPVYEALVASGVAQEGDYEVMDKMVSQAIKQMLLDATYR